MKISVCFKIVPDYDQVPTKDWKGGLSLPDFRFIKKNLGIFDEGALELAACFKDSLKDTYLEAVSVGKPEPIFTEAIYAAGYDNVVYINNIGSEFDPSNTARALAEYFKNSDTDMILCGEQVGPADSGTVPYFLGGLLNFPIINSVSDIFIEDNKVYIERDTAEVTEIYDYPGKMIAVVSGSKHPYLRFASYEEKLKAEKRKCERKTIITFPQITHVVFSKQKNVKKNTVFLDDAMELHKLISEVHDERV